MVSDKNYRELVDVSKNIENLVIGNIHYVICITRQSMINVGLLVRVRPDAWSISNGSVFSVLVDGRLGEYPSSMFCVVPINDKETLDFIFSRF
jgi:hypothetical protein